MLWDDGVSYVLQLYMQYVMFIVTAENAYTSPLQTLSLLLILEFTWLF